MKKISIIAIAALAMSFASCKKDYTCKCTNTPTGGTSSTNTIILKGVSKGTAKTLCHDTESKNAAGIVTSTDKCELSK